MSESTTSMPGGTSPADGTMSAGGPAPAVTGGRPVPAWAWSALLVAAAVWLAFCWTVLRVEPSDMSRWAGAAVLLGAVCEALRAISGGRMWWLNAGMAALFAATGMVIMLDRDGSLATPAALVGWYLLVRGAVDIVTAVVSRANDTAWGLPAAIGVLEVALGFWASSSFARTADALVMMVGALALARGVAELTTSLSLRSAMASTGTAQASRTVQAAGARGYVAGMADFAAATSAGARPGRARHRATGTAITAAAAASKPGRTAAIAEAPVGGEPAAELDAMLALAGVSGAAVGSTMQSGGMPGSASMPSAVGAGLPGGAAMPSGVGVSTLTDTSGTGAGTPVTTPTIAAGGAGTGFADAPGSATASSAGRGALAAAQPARPATMFTAPDVSPGAEGVASGVRRIPAGPPAGMSIEGGPVNAAVQGTQTDTVRISPAAAAGIAGAAAAAHDRGQGAPAGADRAPNRAPGRGPGHGPGQGADRAGDRGADRAAGRAPDRAAEQGSDRPADGGPDRGSERALGRRRAI